MTQINNISNEEKEELLNMLNVNNKITSFKLRYKKIKEHTIIRFSKNFTSNLIRIILFILSLSSLFISLYYLFVKNSIDFFNLKTHLSSFTKEAVFTENMILSLIFMMFFVFFLLISYLLKINNRKRNNIYLLSTLLEEVVECLDQVNNRKPINSEKITRQE